MIYIELTLHILFNEPKQLNFLERKIMNRLFKLIEPMWSVFMANKIFWVFISFLFAVLFQILFKYFNIHNIIIYTLSSAFILQAILAFYISIVRNHILIACFGIFDLCAASTILILRDYILLVT